MTKKLLMLLLLVSAHTFTQIQYRYERELIEVFEDTQNFSFDEKCAITNHALMWLKGIMDDHATGRRSIRSEDREYIARMTYMLTCIYNETEYMGSTNN